MNQPHSFACPNAAVGAPLPASPATAASTMKASPASGAPAPLHPATSEVTRTIPALVFITSLVLSLQSDGHATPDHHGDRMALRVGEPDRRVAHHDARHDPVDGSRAAKHGEQRPTLHRDS